MLKRLKIAVLRYKIMRSEVMYNNTGDEMHQKEIGNLLSKLMQIDKC